MLASARAEVPRALAASGPLMMPGGSGYQAPTARAQTYTGTHARTHPECQAPTRPLEGGEGFLRA
jgi:hypothetical protein